MKGNLFETTIMLPLLLHADLPTPTLSSDSLMFIILQERFCTRLITAQPARMRERTLMMRTNLMEGKIQN